jgi:hypothetical protein
MHQVRHAEKKSRQEFSNVNNHSDNSKIDESFKPLIEELDEVGDDYVGKTPNSVFREKCLTRRFKRRVQRFIQKPKFLKAKQEIIKFQKFSMICAIGNPALPISGKEGLVELFLMTVGKAWDLFVKIGGLIIKFLKNRATSLIKLVMKYPYFSMFTVFVSCALLLLDHLARKFGRKIQWYDRLIILILSLIATWLLSVVIKAEAFKTIIKWLKSILIKIMLILRSLNSSIGSYTQDTSAIDKPKPSKAEDFKVFVFFSVLTALTTRYLLSVFKRKVVGDGPLSDELINILEIDLTDYLPKRLVSRNS